MSVVGGKRLHAAFAMVNCSDAQNVLGGQQEQVQVGACTGQTVTPGSSLAGRLCMG